VELEHDRVLLDPFPSEREPEHAEQEHNRASSDLRQGRGHRSDIKRCGVVGRWSVAA
jgi:hypothetical protein